MLTLFLSVTYLSFYLDRLEKESRLPLAGIRKGQAE